MLHKPTMCVHACVCVWGQNSLCMVIWDHRNDHCMHLKHTEELVINGKIIKSSMICTILVKILKTLLLSIINTHGNCN